MARFVFTVAVVLLGTGVAGAQSAPTPPAPPAADQTQPAPPVELPPPVEPQPVIEVKPAEPPKEEKPPVTIKYDGGMKFSTADDQFELKIQFRNQVRFQATYPFPEETPVRHNQWLDTIYIPRARMQVDGHLFGKANKYRLEFGFGDQGSFAFLKDAFIAKRLATGPFGPTYLRFGQWKRPFNRPEIVSDFASIFNERSIQNEDAGGGAGGGRDLGVAVGNEYDKSPEGVEWVVGMFDQFSGGKDRPTWTTACVQNPTTLAITCVNSRPSDFPVDFQPAIVARAGWNSPKSNGYSESDLDGGPLRYSVGASYKIDLANLTGVGEMSHGFEVDTNIKAYGFSLLAAADVLKLAGEDPKYGFVAQPAMFVIPKHLEGALRFAWVSGIDQPGVVPGTVVETGQIEARGAINWYFHGHTLKLANDFGFLFFTADDLASRLPTFQLRSMLQLQI